MKKIYEKSEIGFAVLWILVYVIALGNLQERYGEDSLYTSMGLILIASVLMLFVLRNKLTEKYGFFRVKDSGRFLYFLPVFILSTLNLWCGITMHYGIGGQLVAVFNMAVVGLVEELIFRGLLFRAMEKENVPRAIIVSSVTFGIGHIINLFTGQASVDTLLQMCYAIAFGFAFMMMFYKSGSLIPSILAHSLIDITSTFSNQNLSVQAEKLFNYLGSALVIVVAGGYAFYLHKLKDADGSRKSGKC